MATTFGNARKVEKPKVGGGQRGDQLFRELIPYVEQARDESSAIELDTNDAKGLRRALRKAGLNVSGQKVTVRLAGAKDGEGAVTFWTVNAITRKAKDEQSAEQPAEQSEQPSRRSRSRS